jgi:hypothetical protein
VTRENPIFILLIIKTVNFVFLSLDSSCSGCGEEGKPTPVVDSSTPHLELSISAWTFPLIFSPEIIFLCVPTIKEEVDSEGAKLKGIGYQSRTRK